MAELDSNRKIRGAYLFLESSSDSSDEEIVANLLQQTSRIVKRPKINGYIEDFVHYYSENEFKRNFRLQRTTCYSLIEEFEISPYYPSDVTHGGSPVISAEKHILSFLWFAGNKSCLRHVASRFDIAETTLLRVTDRVMDYFESVAPAVIKFPRTPEEKEEAAKAFLRVSGFPGVLGCVDGSYIAIRTPAYKIKSTYVNRHDGTSLTLQGICDAKRRFIDVFTGTPSKIHDARIWKLSFISREIPGVCGNQYHVLGDATYPLREWLITPYRDYGNFTNAQQVFNTKFCATRVLIENTFGILKQRFRQLTRTDFHTVDKTTRFILACCVVHNLCIDKGNEWDYTPYLEEDVEIEAVNVAGQRETALKRLGEIKRNTICEILQE